MDLIAICAIVIHPFVAFSLGSIWNAITGGVSDITGFLTDPFGTLEKLFASWLSGLLKGLISETTAVFVGTVPNSMYFLYGVMAPTGVVVAGVAGGARIMRGLFDPRQDGMPLIVDNLIRFGFAFLAIAGGSGIVFTGIKDFIDAIAWVSPQLVWDFSAGAIKGADPLVALFNAVAIGALASISNPATMLIMIIIAICLVLGIVYVLFLWVGRSIMMAFMLAFAPICIGIAVYDPKNKFVQWWMELFLAVAIMPAILWGVLGITIGVCLSTLSKDFVLGPLFAGIMAIGSLWFLAKIINRLVWSGFSHGSFTGAITAASSAAMALPLAANDLSIVGRMAGMKNAAEVAGAGGKPSMANRVMSGIDKFAGMGVSRFGTGPYGTSRPTEISNQASIAKNAFSKLSSQQQGSLRTNFGSSADSDFSTFALGVASKLDPSVAGSMDAATFASLAFDSYMANGSNLGDYGTPQRAASLSQAAQDITSHYLGGKTAPPPPPPPPSTSTGGNPPVRFSTPLSSGGPAVNSPLSGGSSTAAPARPVVSSPPMPVAASGGSSLTFSGPQFRGAQYLDTPPTVPSTAPNQLWVPGSASTPEPASQFLNPPKS